MGAEGGVKENTVKIAELLLESAGVDSEIIGAVRTVVLRDGLVSTGDAAAAVGRCRASVLKIAKEHGVPLLMRRSRLGAMVDLEVLREVMK